MKFLSAINDYKQQIPMIKLEQHSWDIAKALGGGGGGRRRSLTVKMERERQTERQTGRQVDRQTDRQYQKTPYSPVQKIITHIASKTEKPTLGDQKFNHHEAIISDKEKENTPFHNFSGCQRLSLIRWLGTGGQPSLSKAKQEGNP